MLVSAYACSPDRGSECAVGWHGVRQIARWADVWVLCQDGPFGDEIRRYLTRHGPLDGIQFTYVPKSALVRTLMRLPGTYYFGYRLWQQAAYREARRLHAAIGFDLAHQLNLCSFREPGFLGRLGIPFVWGTWGGTGNYPWRFLGEAGLVGGFSEAVRGVANGLQLRFSPSIRRGVRQAAALLANNTATVRDFERVHGVRPELLSASGIAAVGAEPPAADPADDRPFRILWAGRLEAIKALSLLLRALPALAFPVEVVVLGAGPQQRRWQRLARSLHVDDRVRWLGWLPHREALEQYRQADVLVFTSLRDSCPLVVVEALAAGLPVVCLDHMGMADLVTEPCGIKIPVTTPADVVRRLAEAITTLHRDPALRDRLAHAARARAHDYEWSRIGERIVAVYRRVLHGTAIPPSSTSACAGRPPESAADRADPSPQVSVPGRASGGSC